MFSVIFHFLMGNQAFYLPKGNNVVIGLKNLNFTYSVIYNEEIGSYYFITFLRKEKNIKCNNP